MSSSFKDSLIEWVNTTTIDNPVKKFEDPHFCTILADIFASVCPHASPVAIQSIRSCPSVALSASTFVTVIEESFKRKDFQIVPPLPNPLEEQLEEVLWKLATIVLVCVLQSNKREPHLQNIRKTMSEISIQQLATAISAAGVEKSILYEAPVLSTPPLSPITPVTPLRSNRGSKDVMDTPPTRRPSIPRLALNNSSGNLLANNGNSVGNHSPASSPKKSSLKGGSINSNNNNNQHSNSNGILSNGHTPQLLEISEDSRRKHMDNLRSVVVANEESLLPQELKTLVDYLHDSQSQQQHAIEESIQLEKDIRKQLDYLIEKQKDKNNIASRLIDMNTTTMTTATTTGKDVFSSLPLPTITPKSSSSNEKTFTTTSSSTKPTTSTSSTNENALVVLYEKEIKPTIHHIHQRTKALSSQIMNHKFPVIHDHHHNNNNTAVKTNNLVPTMISLVAAILLFLLLQWILFHVRQNLQRNSIPFRPT